MSHETKYQTSKLTLSFNLELVQPRSQGLSSYRPLGRAGGKMRDPGNEVGTCSKESLTGTCQGNTCKAHDKCVKKLTYRHPGFFLWHHSRLAAKTSQDGEGAGEIRLGIATERRI